MARTPKKRSTPRRDDRMFQDLGEVLAAHRLGLENFPVPYESIPREPADPEPLFTAPDPIEDSPYADDVGTEGYKPWKGHKT
jgi:hypothetical protein